MIFILLPVESSLFHPETFFISEFFKTCLNITLYVPVFLGGTNAISTSSWRDGQRLAKKIFGPAPKVEHQDKQPPSNNRSGKERATKSGKGDDDGFLIYIIQCPVLVTAKNSLYFCLFFWFSKFSKLINSLN